MPSPFPGMDPYLENAALWPNVHGRLIVAIADALSPLLLPKYQPVIEEAVYKEDGLGSVMVGVPDVAVQAVNFQTSVEEGDVSLPMTVDSSDASIAIAEPVSSPVVVELPMPRTVRQKFVEIRNTANQEVVTVVEVLSSTNKKGEGRRRYQQKRSRLLESAANLVEVDLLHKGEAVSTVGNPVRSHYRILVSPVQQRPQALLYPFNLPDRLPRVPIPLRAEDTEPLVDFQDLLSQVYDRSGYAFSIDYSEPPTPSWPSAELERIKELAKR